MRATFTAHGAVSVFGGPVSENPFAGLTDIEISDVGGEWMLFVTGRGGGSVTGFELGAHAGDTTENITWDIPDSFLQLESTDLVIRDLGDGEVELFLAGLDSNAIRGIDLSSYGGSVSIDGAFTRSTSGFDSADVIEMALWDDGDKAVVAMADGGIAVVGFENANTLSFENVTQGGPLADEVASAIVVTTTPDGDRVAIVSYGDADMVSLFKMDPSGDLQHVGDLSGSDGLWVNRPGEMAITTGPNGELYVVIASSGSGSLSVVHVADDGDGFQVVEHVIDSLDTRFDDASYVSSISVGGQSFILAAGSDSGISLFVVLDGGRLQHVETIAGEIGSPLDGISGITAIGTADGMRVFVTTLTEPYLVEYSVSFTDLGIFQTGGNGNDVLSGTADDDVLQGGGGNDALSGGNGDDILVGGTGSDTLQGGGGSDVFIMTDDGGLDVILDFDPGQDTIDLSGIGLIGGIGNMTVVSHSWGAELRFGDVVIEVRSWNGQSLTSADFGNWNILIDDRILVDPALYDPNLYPDPEPDPEPEPEPGPIMPPTKTPGPQPDAIDWGTEPEIAEPDVTPDIQGTSGNDTLSSPFTWDVIFGGAGHDLIVSGSGNDIICGDAGADTIEGQGDNDLIFGGTGFDTLFGGRGDDTLVGGGQADYLDGGLDNDVLIGGDGFDQLIGGAGDDTLWSGDSADRLYGGDGDDWMHAGGTEGYTVDGMWGGDGNDMMYGGIGFDMLDGGAGNDVMDGGDQADNLLGGAGDDIMFGGGGLDRLFGGDGTDQLVGGSGRDGLFGGSGDDVAWGGSDNDRLFGGVGNDILLGETGNDTLYGGAGFDVIDGGVGDDILFGNFNADRFVFREGHGHDIIMDFAENNIFERIDFAGFDGFDSTQDVLDAATQIGEDVMIATGADSSILLMSVLLGDLGADDFVF